MRGRSFREMKVVGLLLAAVLAAGVPAHASGGFLGFGTMGCNSGRVVVKAVNVNGTDWIFDVTVACAGAQAPQQITVAGSWNSRTGGTVNGFGTGLLVIGPIGCQSTSNVSITVGMIGSPILAGTFSVLSRASTDC